MRYLLDTCIMLYMLNKTGEMSDDVEAIVSDYALSIFLLYRLMGSLTSTAIKA